MTAGKGEPMTSGGKKRGKGGRGARPVRPRDPFWRERRALGHGVRPGRTGYRRADTRRIEREGQRDGDGDDDGKA